MRRLFKILGMGLGVLMALLLVAIGVIYVVSNRRLHQTHQIPPLPVLTITTDSASVARGAHLAQAVANCVECHGTDLGGKVFMDAGPVGIAVGSNLTKGRGGLGTTFTDEDWIRAIRHGVRRDGTSLLVMPSETFVHMSDPDLAALIAYLKQLPPIDRELPPTHLRLLGRALLVTGRLPLLVAEKTQHLTQATTIEPGPTVEYGRYLADISGCRGCHGLGLSGGHIAGPPGTPQASNLTPAGLGSWTETDFRRALREGIRPDGSTIDEFMPWRITAGMTDEELHALWLYLQSVPPQAFGNK